MRKICLVFANLFLLITTIGFVPAQSLVPRSAATTAEVERRVQAIVDKMTIEEKIDLLGGVDGFYIRGVERLGVPRLKMADGPIGVRNFGPATTMAGGIALAASWNPALAERVGIEIARDARAKGVHFLLGPGVNIYRAPMNGRNFEYFGEDPYLASRIAVGYIRGMQSQGVSATIKHFMGNNSEFDRHNSDAVIDERTLREIYLPVFEAAVKEAHVGAIMDAYGLVNGAHMTQNGYLNTDVVKKEWGFDGIMMSDWVATYDAVAAANGGLDLEMPSAEFMNRKNLLPAIEQGKVSVATIDEKVRAILRTAARFGWLDHEQTDLDIPRYNPQGRQIALEAARESMVLLKNEGNLLPLDRTKTKTIAVIGPNAYPAVPVGGGSAAVAPFSAISFLEGISTVAGSGVKVLYHPGLISVADAAQATNFWTAEKNGAPGLKNEVFENQTLSGTPATHIDQHVNFSPVVPSGSYAFAAHEYSARWSGYYTADKPGDYWVFTQTPRERGNGMRLYVDDKLIFDGWKHSVGLLRHARLSFAAGPHKIVLEQYRALAFGGPRIRLGIARVGTLIDPTAKALAAKADVVVVAVGFNPESESEGGDRTFALPLGHDELIQELAAVNKKTIAVVTSGGSAEMSQWIDRIPALIEAWYPGQEGGTALAQVLFGEVNPSGRLPVTFERRWEDNPTHDSYYPAANTDRVEYKEGVFVGYRGYEHNGTKPLFPFGFGLSYTSFKLANLAVKAATSDASGPHYEVSFDVQNTGNREGAAVAQVYVGDKHAKVPRPASELKGFVKVSLRPGEKKRVAVALDGRALSYYDVHAKQWRAEAGDFEVLVGSSSAAIELRGKLTLTTTTTANR